VKKWEYTTVNVDLTGWIGTSLDVPEFDAVLNAHGDQGWELVSVVGRESNGYTASVYAVFKRELPQG
jgi:hypothetical protein